MRFNIKYLLNRKKLSISISFISLFLIGLIYILTQYNFYLILNIPLQGSSLQVNADHGSINIFIPKDKKSWLYLHNFNKPITLTTVSTNWQTDMPIFQMRLASRATPPIEKSARTNLSNTTSTDDQKSNSYALTPTATASVSQNMSSNTSSQFQKRLYDPNKKIYYDNSTQINYPNEMTSFSDDQLVSLSCRHFSNDIVNDGKKWYFTNKYFYIDPQDPYAVKHYDVDQRTINLINNLVGDYNGSVHVYRCLTEDNQVVMLVQEAPNESDINIYLINSKNEVINKMLFQSTYEMLSISEFTKTNLLYLASGQSKGVAFAEYIFYRVDLNGQSSSKIMDCSVEGGVYTVSRISCI